MHVIDMIFFWAKAVPQRPAIMLPDITWSYKALADAIEAISARIARYDLDKTEPVAVSIRSEPKFLAVCLALIRLGYTVAPVAPSLFPLLRPAGINNVISQRNALMLSGGKNVYFDDNWISSPDQETRLSFDPNAYGDLIFFTSGTTGLPKKVVEKKEATLERFKTSIFSGHAHHSRILIIPGLGSHFGFNLACDVLRAGKTLSFSISVDERTLWIINAFGIEHIDASVQQALGLCELAERSPGYRFDRLRTIRIGGASPSRELIRRVQNRICKDVVIIYASTEASQAATARYEAIENIPDAVGFIVPWAEVEIVDESNNPVPPETEGSVRYRTPYFLKNRDGNNAEWFYPGDLGRITANRVLCITGRSDDVINRGGTKFSAAAAEREIMRFPGLKDAGLCGVRDLSELVQVWLAVVPGENFDDVAFRQFLATDAELREKLRVDIDRIAYVEEIPRGELGKIKRHELRASLLRVARQSPH